MKKRTVLLLGLLGCLMFTTIQGCGQPAEEETVSVVEETVSESMEESTVSEETTASEEETIEETEESSVEETVPIETETTTETEVPTETETIEEVSITEMDATMYATTGVNVRESYSAESNKLRTVGVGEAVHVTGQTADGSWYRIEDTGVGEGFISAQYLSTEKPVIVQPAPSEPVVEQPVVEQSAPAETTPSTSTGSAQAPNPGAQAVYDSVNSGQSTFDPSVPAPGATPDNINGDMFKNAIDGSHLLDNSQGAGGILHAAD